jgi:hypothetical protein
MIVVAALTSCALANGATVLVTNTMLGLKNVIVVPLDRRLLIVTSRWFFPIPK